MKLKIAIGGIILLVSGVLGLILYNVSQMDTEEIILCVSDEGGIRIPSEICEYYMYNHRNIKSDVDELAAGAGLDYILSGYNKEKKYKIAEFYILNGLDVNGINHYSNLTPIYTAVLFNDAEMAEFLLKHGAELNTKIPIPSIDMTPLEFTLFLQNKDPSIDRTKMIEALSQQN